MRNRDYKLIKALDTGEVEFYDLEADPGETNDLSAEKSPHQRALEVALDRQREKSAALQLQLNATPQARKVLSDEDRTQLRALGYVD